jgi:GntR family transcriptional regulator
VISHPATLFSISPGSLDPIYRQLIDQLRRLIASGQLMPGDALPSVRELAQALAVNPMTVSKSYAMLETEGVLVRSRGVGMLVAPQTARSHHPGQREKLLRPTLEKAAREARQLELDPAAAIALFAKILKEQR